MATKRGRMEFSDIEKKLLQKFYYQHKEELDSGNSQLRKNIIERITLLFNSSAGIKAVSSYYNSYFLIKWNCGERLQLRIFILYFRSEVMIK